MRILIADDDRVGRRLLERLLKRWGYETTVASDGAEAWRCLQSEDAPHLVLLDWMMPGMSGLEICRRLRQRGGNHYSYVVILTTRSGKQDIVQGMEAGADDYLIKPFAATELKARLLAGQRIVDLQEQLIAVQEHLRFQASHDALTGLWNRRAILDILQCELARSRREHASLGVILADVDHFKQINDTFGHQAGDMCLRQVAERLRSSVRIYDSVGRYGGEEFLLIVPRSGLAETSKLAERLRLGLAARPVVLASEHLEVTASFGITAAEAGEADPEELLTAADRAVYCAKDQGRNRVESVRAPQGLLARGDPEPHLALSLVG